MNDSQSQIDAAVALIRREWNHSADFGVVLGTGLGRLADCVEIEATFPYANLPGLPTSTALGHRGQLICGRLGETPVILMDGRCHVYEGYTVAEITRPIRVMHALGVSRLIVTNAAGGLNPQFALGDVVVIEDHLDLMFTHHHFMLSGSEPRAGAVARYAYDRELLKYAHEVARRENVLLQRGVYAAMTGPSYETRAEYRFLRRIGADVVGMSTVPEVVMATEIGVRCIAFSIVTNLAKPDSPSQTDAHDVVTVADRASSKIQKIVLGLLERV